MPDTIPTALKAGDLPEVTTGPLPASRKIHVPGALHPVERRWHAPPPGVLTRDDRGVTPGFLDHVAATTRLALDHDDGDAPVPAGPVGVLGGRTPGGADADAARPRAAPRLRCARLPRGLDDSGG